jgi:hypothetical protein
MKASEPRRQPAQTTLANPLAARARTYGGKRVACALIGLALLLRPGVAAAWTGDPWGPLSRAAIQATADLMIDSTWTPKNTITNWEYGSTYHTFTKGVTYTGVAYSQHNPQENWTEFYNYVTSTSGGTTYYGNDCSGFASICWRLPARKTTYLFESQLGTYWISLGEKGSAATAPLLLSDALNSESDHIVLFLRRDPAGVATMEQTPYHAQRKVRSYSALSSYRPIRRLAITDAPVLTQAGLSRVVDEGEAVSLSVSASGTEPLSYRWRFNGAPLAGATTSQLTFPAAQLTNAGNYLCVVSNTSGSVTSRVMSLTVYPAQRTVFLDDFETNSAARWVVNRSSADTRVTFHYDYGAMGIPAAPHTAGGTTRGLRMEANLTAGVAAAVSLSPLGQQYRGDYRVRFDLWLNANGPFPEGGAGSTQHATAGVGTAGDRVEWGGSGSGADGYWFAVDGEGQASDTSASSGDYCAYAGAALQSAGSGVYTAGTEANAKGNLHEYYVAAFPGGATAPGAQQAAYAQQTGSLAGGTVGFAWREVMVARRGNEVDWAIDGVRLARLTNAVWGASNVFVGYWDMFASLTDNTNVSFGVVDNVRVEVPVTEPVITEQPQSRALIAGENLVLRVGAMGPGTLSYQWQRHGTNLAGATAAVLILPEVQPHQAGPYTVVVSNAYGSVLSQEAQVTVSPVFAVDGWQSLWGLAPGSRPYLTTNSLPFERGMAYDPQARRLVLVSRVEPRVYVLDAETGADVGELGVSGISGGIYPLLMVGVADDGVVYAANLTTGGATTAFKLYRWASSAPGTEPTLAYAGDPGAGNNQRWGDTLDVRGAGAGTQVILASRNGSVVAVLTTADGQTFSAKLVTVAGVPNGAFGLGLGFGASNTFWGKATGQNLRQVSFDLASGQGTVLRDYAAPLIPASLAPLGVSPALHLLAGIKVGSSGNQLQLYDLTPSNGVPVLVGVTNFMTDYDNNGSGTGAVDFGGDRVYALCGNNGLVALQVQAAAVPWPPAEPGRFEAIHRLPDGAVQLTMSGTAHTNYLLQWTADWLTWSNLGMLSSPNGLFAWVDGSASNAPRRFYRLQLGP